MRRRPLDFYPTPPDVVRAVERWLDRSIHPVGGTWIDPAAGAGALLSGVRRFASRLVAYELDDGRRELLAEIADEVTIGDALAIERWDRGHVIANPPYNVLEAFVERIVRHCRKTESLGLVLTRLQWLDDGEDRHKRFRPDAVLRMPWRVSFTGDGKTEATTHAWLVYMPASMAPPLRTSLEWLERPVVSGDEWERHRELSGSIPQLHLFGELEGTT